MPSLPVWVLLFCLAAALVIVLSLSKGAGLLLLFTRIFPSTRAQILRVDRESREAGFDPHGNLERHVGQEGILVSDARPAGKARLGGETVPVVSRDGYLARGVRVRAIGFHSGSVVVCAIDEC